MAISGKAWIFTKVIGMIIPVVFLFVVAMTVRLICNRSASDNSVNCMRQTTLLGFITLGEDEIRDVRGTTVTASPPSEDSATGYRLEMLTGQGNVPLTSTYWGDASSTQDNAGRINDFVQGETGGDQLVITDTGFFSGANMAALLFLYLMGLVLFITKMGAKRGVYIEDRWRLLRAAAFFVLVIIPILINALIFFFLQITGTQSSFLSDFLGTFIPFTVVVTMVFFVAYGLYLVHALYHRYRPTKI